MIEPKVVFEPVLSRWRVESRDVGRDDWRLYRYFPTLDEAREAAQRLTDDALGCEYRVVDTKPEPKPWHDAQPDEVWALAINNDREEVFRCGENGLYQLKTGIPLGSLLSCGSNKITAGYRI